MKKMLTYISRTVVISDSLSGTEEEAKEDEIEVAEDDQEPIYVSVGLEDIVSVGKFIQTPFLCSSFDRTTLWETLRRLLSQGR
jgi:hypothetical protein